MPASLSVLIAFVARRRRWWTAIAAVAVAIVSLWSGIGAAIDRDLDPLRSSVLTRPASGKLVVVEMDAASAAAIEHYPWPRDHYAKVVDRLLKAGATSIVFDVDFSSPATPAGDAAFADTLSRSNGAVALPTFGQQARSGAAALIDTRPLPIFRDHAALASVTMVPDADGVVRQAPLGTITYGVPRPSLSAYTAQVAGTADSFFPIDFALDPATIPRLSFVAVRDGQFDPAVVRGRTVLIGATAIEMGDRYAVPRWGVLPGVIVQAMAAETLMRKIPFSGGALIPLALALALALLVLGSTRARTTVAAAVASLVALIGAALVTQVAAGGFFPIGPALVLLSAAILGQGIWLVWTRFRQQRLVDESTGLPNRRAMLLAVGSTPRLAVVHLTNFEALAAVLGKAADRDLVQRLAERVRLASDDGQVYRLADRLLAFTLSHDGDLDEVMAALRSAVLHPVEVLGRRVDANVTVGVADGGDSLDAMLTDAALAAELAARNGSFWRRADADLGQLERQVSLMGELDDALRDGGIEVHYQPKLSLADDRITSCEALVRWRHASRGFIGPDLFIPLAEQTDRIAPLTLHVIEQVMHDLAGWRRLGHELTAAVNISAKLVASAPFNRQVRALLARRIVPPSALVFEVTESATLADPAAAAEALEDYRALGIAISMDDYGTGQSTLTYLRQLPLSELKIDRSFVQHCHRSRSDGVLVRSTIELAHELGLKVVAEGIEEPECLAFLRQLGCDLAQGYLISRPITATALLDMLDRPSAVAA